MLDTCNIWFQQLVDTIGTIYRRLNTLDDHVRLLVENLVYAGYGGLRELGPTAFDVPALIYSTVPFSTVAVTTPKEVTQDPATNSLSVAKGGVWLLVVSGTLAGHDSSNQGRTFNLRLWNATESVGGSPIPIGVGRNVEDTNFSVTVLVELLDTDIGDIYQLELGGVDAITGGELVGLNWMFTHVSEYKEALG
jgi:hypothetical protein